MTNTDKKVILIVEDEFTLKSILRDKLVSSGFTCLSAKDGVEGLTMAIKSHPDLILLDIIMPRMNGVEMLKKLREDKWGKNAVVLLLTNDTDPQNMSETLKINAADYLIKSDWGLEDIVNKIKIILGM